MFWLYNMRKADIICEGAGGGLMSELNLRNLINSSRAHSMTLGEMKRKVGMQKHKAYHLNSLFMEKKTTKKDLY